MHNELFSIGPLTFHMYGLMIGIGVLSAYAVTSYRAKRMNVDMEVVDALAVWILVGGIASAKLLYWITQIENIIKDPRMLLDLTNGFVVYGGILGGILAGFIYCRVKKKRFFKYFDLIIPVVSLAQGFGRIGCFFAGCCYGLPTASRFGVEFPLHSLAPHGVRLVPIQLVASGLDFLLFAVLMIVAGKKHQDGQVAAGYLICYSAGRFILEFFRGDLVRGSVGVISTSQFISLFMFFFGCLLLYALHAGWRRGSADVRGQEL